ncbi:MAG: 2,4-dihydroxyhept-2-ene-1,7-dioic acid aldolase [Proteobacteria bacterium]|nr:2,4-dihydroxyhept-2-ene-1,7-dioic acid aldolase [Pseudomonadota bacterium]MCK4869047.1 2,4-dihydroxyhept-2-ene-1,7-dioic acid aldolase [Alphaproteobacteria bacterium]
MYRKNQFKNRMLAGERCFGCWLHLCSPIAAEVLALAGYDAMIIDHEHGSGELVGAIQIMQAMSATPASSILRVPWNDPVALKRALDAGPEGVMIPSINSASEARAAVAACRYPPGGTRGAAYGLVRASDYGLAAKDYFENVQDNLLIICQIETAEAVDAIPEIAAVDGVDMLFIGPIDLSGSIGKLGQFDDAAVIALRERAEDAIKAAGKLLGGLAVPNLGIADMAARGYDFVTAASDITLLRDAALAQLKDMRKS